MEDQFYLFRLLYEQWFKNPPHYVDGNFFHFKKNIISVHTIDEMTEMVEAKESKKYHIEYDNEFRVDIVDAKYIIPGGRQIGLIQKFISKSYYNEFSNESDQRFCLVAELESDDVTNPTIDDYSFKFKLLTIQEIHECYNHENINRDDIINKRTILAVQSKHNKNQAFKSSIVLPPKALPKKTDRNKLTKKTISIPINNYYWANATGMGVFSGENSPFRCLDIDGCDSIEFLDSFLSKLGLGEYYPWVIRTGSGEGFHIWISCNDSINPELLLKGDALKYYEKYGVVYYMPKSVYKNTFRVIELRWNSFCMLPPSKGPTGIQYQFRRHLPQKAPKSIPLGKILKTINSIAENPSILYGEIIKRDLHYGGFSLSEETETMFLCFDTETTGLPKNYDASFYDTENWPRIVQLSYILFVIQENKIKLLKKQNVILSPDNSFRISTSSTNIHGISDRDARNMGFNRKYVLQTFAKQLNEVDYLIGHNVEFDINVLRAEFERENIDVSHPFNHIKRICTMKSSMPLYPKGSYWPKLENLYHKLTGEHMKGAHNSMNDTIATYRCFKKLINKGLIKVNKTINYNSIDNPANSW